MGDFLGAGNFGQVHQAMDVNTGEIFAVKSILFPRETFGREE